jgi:hypothetical protein
VRPSDRVALGPPKDLFFIHRLTEFLEPLDHDQGALAANGPEVIELCEQLAVLLIKEITEDVQLAVAVGTRQLDTGDHLETGSLGPLPGLRDPQHGVVVGEGESDESLLEGALHHGGWGFNPVGQGRVGV